MEIKKVLINPEKAKTLLDKMITNRRLNKAYVNFLTSQMQQGEWQENTGETIKLNPDGVLTDGQHRLHAIIKSGKELHLYVAYDVPQESFTVIDTGKPRNAGDSLAFIGVVNSHVMASIIKKHHSIGAGIPAVETRYHHDGDKAKLILNNRQVVQLYEDRADFWEEVKLKSGVWQKSFASCLARPIIGAFFALFYEIDNEDAETYFDKLCNGTGLSETDAILHLRNKLITDKGATTSLSDRAKMLLVVKTWNKFRKKEITHQIKYIIGEKFPVAV